MKRLLSIILLFAFVQANAQVIISGNVKDEYGDAVPFASVYLDENFKGASSNLEGVFQFNADDNGSFTLVASAVGYETTKQKIEVGAKSISFQIILSGIEQSLGPVVITAGSFDASVEAKSSILKPLDIVMNAGAQGDIYKAIETLPGVSKVGDETGLFVRGGDAHETKTIIDGVIVTNPFYGETPNIASRSRFDPFMFKGTTFTTGGYSAEYGDALSSILILNTQDVPDESMSSIGLNMAGITLSHQQVWDGKTVLMGSVNYNNLKLLFNSVPQNTDWQKEPEGVGTNFAFRHKTKNGIFKSMVQYQQGEIGVNIPNLDVPNQTDLFTNKNKSTYWNTTYKGVLTDKLGVYAGFALNRTDENRTFDTLSIADISNMYHLKTTLYYDLNEKAGIKFGIETFSAKDEKTVFDKNEILDQSTAAYAEADIALGNRWALRVGMRSEHSSILGQMNLAPRTSVAYKTGKNSQVSLAYGHFYQKPEENFLYINTDLNYEKSTHLIANYQWSKNDRSFRVELYDKQYSSLVKGANEAIDNSGNGASRGVDIFWKDAKTINNLNYWVSYSYVDAKRNYKDYPMAATPDFVTDHTLNVVANYALPQYGLTPGLTYTFASGRRYENPNNDLYLSDKTIAYHNLGLNLSYVTKVFSKFTVLYASVTNPLGFEQIFGYEYSSDHSTRSAIKPAANRTFFLGLFVNF
ncbi:MAG: TonB-dependent receptor [Reichenbachiella sp.]